MNRAEMLVHHRDRLRAKLDVIEQWQRQTSRPGVLSTATRVPRILFWLPGDLPDKKMAVPDEVSDEFWSYLEGKREGHLEQIRLIGEELDRLHAGPSRYGTEA